MRASFVLVALWALGCAAAKPPAAPVPAASVATTPGNTPSVTPTGTSAVVAEEWLTKLDRDNALVGKIWDVKAGAFVEPGAMLKRLVAARFVLLGERHDNPDHHRLQGRVLGELVKAGRRPALVLEMLEVPQQADVDRYLARADANAAGLGAAL